MIRPGAPPAAWVHDPAEDSHPQATDRVLVARDDTKPFRVNPGLRAQTDDFNNLFTVLK